MPISKLRIILCVNTGRSEYFSLPFAVPEINAHPSRLINERRNGNHMKLEANNLEHYVGNLRREMEDLLNDNVTLFHRAQRAERELARMKAAQRRHNEP